jgi:hypothetical protein
VGRVFKLLRSTYKIMGKERIIIEKMLVRIYLGIEE